MATQSLSDSAKSGLLDILQESCPTKIFLPNNEAFNKGSDNTLGPYDFYKVFGLNDVQISIIKEAVPKSEYYFVSPLGTRLFNMALGRLNLAFTSSNSKSDVRRIGELYSKDKDHWAYNWLDEKGINYRPYQNLENTQGAHND